MKRLWCRVFHRPRLRYVAAARMTIRWCYVCEEAR